MTTTEIDTYITKRVAMEFAMGSTNQLYSIALNGTSQYLTIGLDPQFATQPATPAYSVNPSTAVNSATDLITVTHGLVNNDVVTYVSSSGNTVITGLANNASYFVVQSNGTVFGLSTTLGGSLINLTAGAISETGHAFKRQFTESLPKTSQDFTIEGWIYLNAHTAATPCVFSTYSLAAGSTIGPGSLAFYAGNASLAGSSATTWSVVINNSTIINGTTAITNQLWHHFAIVRSGSTITLYIDGVANGTATYAGPIVSPFRTLILGTDGGAQTTSYINGYIHRFRIVVGEAVYTSAFTARNLSPLSHFNNTTLHIGAQRTHYNSLNILDYGVLNNPVTPVGLNSAAISASQTNLLLTTPANGSFLVDTSTNAFVATNIGGAVSNTSSPVGTGSIQLSGSTQYITYAVSNTTMSVATSTPFTIEFWMYATTQVQTAPSIFSTTNNGGLAGHMSFFVGHAGFAASKQYCLYWVGMPAGIGGEKTATNLLTSTGTYITNQWTHIAIVRSGTSAVTLYVNGVPNATTTYTGAIVFTGDVFYLGTSGDSLSGSSFTGNISNFRFVNGVAVYNGIFNPPIAPFQTSQVATTTTPNVSAVNPYNVGSISFNGSSQYLSAPSNSGFAFGTGDFTLEAWIYVAGGASNRTIVSTRPTSAGYTTAGSLGVDSGGGVYWYTNGYTAQNTSSQGLTSSWNHIAVVRNGSGASNLKIYVNGTSVITATDSTNYTAQVLSIGGNNDGSELFNGNITCVRVVTGTAAYTANFNRSLSVPSEITNTKLLMYVRNNTDWLVDDASGLTITATGSPVYSQTPFCPVSTKSNVGTLGVGQMDFGTSIGSWVDTWYPQDSFFTAATNQTVTLYQDLQTAPAVGFANRPLGWNSALSGLQQMPDTDLNTRISSRVVSYMTASQGIGSYWLGAARPTIGGNWVQRATFTNTLNPTIVNTAIEQATITFNNNSGINADTDVIATSAHRFNNNDIVTYTCSTGNTCAQGLANGASYYIVNTVSGGTTLQLSSTIGGTPVNVTGSISETGHTFTLSSNTYLWQKVSESPGSGLFGSQNGFQYLVPYIGLRSFTFEFWFQFTQMPQGNWYWWVATGTGSSNFPTLTFGTPQRAVQLGAAAPFSSLGSMTFGVFNGGWHHLALVYRGSTYSITFNALTGVANTTEFITTSSAHSFVNNDPVYYTVYTGNTAIGGLTANSGPYYVINANTTALQLSTTVSGAAINLTAGLNETGHVLAKDTYFPNTAYCFVDGVLANSVAGNFVPGLNTTFAVNPGAGGNGSTPIPSGKIAHLRLTSGGVADALYTSNFTPPRGPITATANTRVYAACLSEATMNVNSSPITVVTASFNALSGVNSTTDFITTLSPHSFANGDQVVYSVATGNTAIGGLNTPSANQSYYVINANTTALQLSTTLSGANVNITAGSVSETGHTLTRGSTITTNSIAWSPMNPYTEAGVYGFTSNNIPVIYSPTSGPVKRALEDDIRTIVNQTRNYIVSSNIGKYALSATAPTPGTWVAVGPGIIDTKRKVGTYTPPRFTKEYTGAFTGTFTGGATGVYAGGSYTRGYTGVVYAAEYTMTYTGGPYTPAAYTVITTATELGVFTAQITTYTQAYTSANPVYNTYTTSYGAYTAVWTSPTLTYTLSAVGTAAYTGQWTGGTYARVYTRGGVFGTFTGLVYTATVAPVYNTVYTRGLFTGIYTGAAYNQLFTKLYTLGGVVSAYTATVILPAVETVQTIKLWVRTA